MKTNQLNRAAVFVNDLAVRPSQNSQPNVNLPVTKPIPVGPPVADFWNVPATITPNNFVYKSLSNWAFNTAIGCSHACRFCYVPSAATVKQGPALGRYGVHDPDAEWGNYVLLRPWDEKKFLASLRAAERTPLSDLKSDGNRAVMFCSTTDPYQVIRSADPLKGRELNEAARMLVTRSLELIRDESTLNVRILTRSPLAKRDFELFKSFGPRLLFGMSLPTLNEKLARVYEPKAPSPGQRLATLRAAAEAGLHVYVAVAPTYPECDEEDLAATLEAVGAVRPVTIFHEPINIRAENVARIESHAKSLGFEARTDVFATPEAWQDYALSSLKTVERIASDLGLGDRLHLWPDKGLGSKAAASRMADPESHLAWLQGWWNRISEWPSSGSARPLTRASADPLKITSTALFNERRRV
jgi:DNA repair photolyase